MDKESVIPFSVTNPFPLENVAKSESTADLIEPEIPISQFKSTRHFLLATLVLVGEALLAVAEGQLGSIALTTKGEAIGQALLAVTEGQLGSIANTTENEEQRLIFNAPFLYTLIRFTARCSAFPIVMLFFWLKSILTKDKDFRMRSFIRECSRLAPGREFTVKNIFTYYTLPTITSLAVGVCYMLAITYIPASVTSACFCSTLALSYVVTIVFLKGRHIILKTVFVLISFGGVAMIAYETSINEVIKDDAYIGIICILISCFSLALHQLFYVRSFPNANPNQVAFTVTVMYIGCVLLLWPVPVALRLVNIEEWSWDTAPWGFVMGAAVSSLAVAFLYSFGLALSSPFFISLGELLDSAIMAVVDYARGLDIGPLQIIGSIIVGISFVILLIPEERLSVNIRDRVPLSSSFDLQSVSTQNRRDKPTSKVFPHSYSTSTIL